MLDLDTLGLEILTLTGEALLWSTGCYFIIGEVNFYGCFLKR